MEENKEVLEVEDELSIFQITLNILNEFKIWLSLFKRNLKIPTLHISFCKNASTYYYF